MAANASSADSRGKTRFYFPESASFVLIRSSGAVNRDPGAPLSSHPHGRLQGFDDESGSEEALPSSTSPDMPKGEGRGDWYLYIKAASSPS